MGYNLDPIAAADTGLLHLKDSEGNLLTFDKPRPDGNGTVAEAVQAEIYGPGSAAYTKAAAKKQAALMARVRKGNKTPSGDEQREENAQFLAAITKRFINLDYEPLDVYRQGRFGFLAEQVEAFVGDWANFTGASLKN